MTFYQPIAISYRGEEFPSTLVYESEEEAEEIKYEFKSKLQREFHESGSSIKLEKVRVTKVIAVFTDKTKREMKIDEILKD